MKLLFIFTGGTIGSTRNGDVISADANKSYKIIDAYRKAHGIDFEYDVTEPYTELSENNTGLHMRALCGCIRENLGAGYDGIIATHGSDTLQYTAAAVGYCIGLDTEPVCLVAANAPIESPDSNAIDNLHGAIRFIAEGEGRGAFAVYRNSTSDTVRVHRATRLIGAKAYSDDLSSANKRVYGIFDSNFKFIKDEKYAEAHDGLPPFDPELLGETNEGAAVLFSYPGMSYPELSERTKYVIVNTYHSGTLNTKSEKARHFFAAARAKGIPVYATGISEGPQYESAESFRELGITPVTALSPVAAYIKLWLAYSAGIDPEAAMRTSLSGDIVL